MSTSHFRNRLPSHPLHRKPTKADDDAGSVDAGLTDDAESMFDLAARTRREREARIDPVGIKRRAKGRKTR
jgi:hypothetical protein